jgi:DNA-binding LacI/PurR family transcriptional regulator
MRDEHLYLALKNKICELIYKDVYKSGENLPPERTLAENLGVSRVTVRKALQLLETDGIIERVQGSGTVVRLKKTGYQGNMDIIALLAPANRPFFSTFIDYFQKISDKHDSLVLFKQNSAKERVEDSLFKLFQKNIRNVVLWLEDLKLDSQYIGRLRGLGMNIVFFDITAPSQYADCVFLDNTDAINKLHGLLRVKGTKNICYVGWDNLCLSSIRERERAFKILEPNNNIIFHISWKEKNNLLTAMYKFVHELKSNGALPGGIICGDGEIGIALKKALISNNMENIILASVDDFPEACELSLSVYMQDFDSLAQRVYQCLLDQNMNAEKWEAGIHTVKGNLIER